ncbi:pyridoxal phosphate-dependent aminotransferase [Acuticoccus sp. M5D2P5]|uniref:pyridoxal phosphate-dependent aminotransferase n=1 Tax=Acuticoccus kalidii TaxID=2910977 RepID=UPI001F32935A|nr:pyridoxal phosphate-dependent aminotransferase [Acuticoccus kalidii]MCF3932645.1 pyridoxal phosphate-dependent aminotransferase [Acuticoccus kalidii]
MKYAQRALDIAPFFAMEFSKRAAALEAAGHNVAKLNIGEPDFGAPPAVLTAMADIAKSGQLPYTDALGLPALREAIAGFYRSAHGLDIDPQRIVVTAGASAALLLVTAALVDPGDEVIVGDPSYPCNRHFLSGFGARVKLVPTRVESRFQLDAETVRANWTPATRGLMIATPSNPTGTSIVPSELVETCAFAEGKGAWRIVDEIYLNLSDADAAGNPPQSALAVDPGAVVINSFSKYFGMTGWRLGWCVLPEDMVRIMEPLAQNYYICPSAPAQRAALQCFTPESIAVCEARRAEFQRRRAFVLSRLAEIGLPVPVPPDGAFYVYIDISATGLDAMRFCERAVEEAHVTLTPGLDFGHSGADKFVRLSYAASMEDLAEGLDRLKRFINRLGGANTPIIPADAKLA